MSRPQRPIPEPLETNEVAVVGVGIGLWGTALAVLLVVGLPPDQRWWLWTCVAGIVGGFVALAYVYRRSRSTKPPRRTGE